MIDFHVHLAGSGCCNSGIFLSKSFQRRYTFLALRVLQKVSDEELRTDIDEVWVRRIENLVAQSTYVDKAVGLCLDAVYDEHGNKQEALTQMAIPNSWGKKISANSGGKILFGGSVHPYRKDAVQELRRLKEEGVTLIKWLPSVLGIDPANPLCEPFYHALRELRIPLLSHTDTEKTFAHLPGDWSEKNDVARLERPLKAGVTVIAAHAGTPGQVGVLEDLASRYPNLFADTSGLFNPARARASIGLFKKAAEGVLKERLLFATDWPIPVLPIFIADKLGLAKYRVLSKISNPFDRDAATKEALGFSRKQFEENESNLLTSLDR